jgi:hypothetical protein
MARAVGMFRASPFLTFASQTNSHDNAFSVARASAKENVNQNFLSKCKVHDSSERTHARSLPRNVDRTNYSPHTAYDVRRALNRVRNAGAVAPKKKNAK